MTQGRAEKALIRSDPVLADRSTKQQQQQQQ